MFPLELVADALASDYTAAKATATKNKRFYFSACKIWAGAYFWFNAAVAQLVEQLIRNQQVSGSNPLGGCFKGKFIFSAANSFPISQSKM